jgi:hypothetical protein
MSGLLSGLLGNGTGSSLQSRIYSYISGRSGRPGESLPGSTGQSILIRSRQDTNSNGTNSRGNSVLFRLFAAAGNPEFRTIPDDTTEAETADVLLQEVSPPKAQDVAQDVHGTTGGPPVSPWFFPSATTLDRFEFLYEDVLEVSVRSRRTPVA